MSSVLASVAAAQIQQVQLDWTSTVDGPSTFDSDASSVCTVDASGRVITSGVSDPTTTPLVGTKVVTIAQDSSGNVLWSQEVSPGFDEFVTGIASNAQGEVYVCGYSLHPNITNEDIFLVKYAANGVQQWLRTYAGANDAPELAYTLALDASGNVLLVGTARTNGSQRDMLVIEYSPAGSIVWERRIDGGVGGSDEARALSVLPNGEIVVVGTLTTVNGEDAAAVKLSPAGAVVWTSAFDGGTGLGDGLVAVATTAEPRIVVGGHTQTAATRIDYLAVELDPTTGAQDWLATYTSATPGNDELDTVAIGPDGTTWVSGWSDPRIATVRFDRAGAQLSASTWMHPLGGTIRSQTLMVGAAGQAWNHVGSHSASANLLAYDSSGEVIWDWNDTGFPYRAFAASRAPNDRLVIAGSHLLLPSGEWDFLTIQIDLGNTPDGYCAAKTTSTGCVPFVSFVGNSSAPASGGFVVRCSQLRNQKNGLLFYGVNGPANLPFQGGTMCVAAPQLRTMIQSSGGNASPADDCSGSLELDMNAYASGALGGTPLFALQQPGTTVHCQFWGRDPGFAPPQNTMLSNALRYVVLP